MLSTAVFRPMPAHWHLITLIPRLPILVRLVSLYLQTITPFIVECIVAAYPSFGAGFFSNEPSVDPFAIDPSPSPPVYQIGLLQPKDSFVHHRYGVCLPDYGVVVMSFATVSSSDCTQIPKLRVACASGVNGQRSMWTHCEQCGAISIVESD